MAWNIDSFPLLGGLVELELSNTGSQKDGTRHGSGTTNKMDTTRSRKVEDLAVEEAIRRPDPMGGNGVDESSQKETVDKVGAEAATFSDGT